MTENLRFGRRYRARQVKTFFDFSGEGGFARAVEMCNGAAVCRRSWSGTMCPSFMATRDEKHSTRGRANALRDAMPGHLPAEDLTSPAHLRGARSLPGVQGVQDRMPVQRRHGQAQDRVPGPLPRRAWHAAPRSPLRPHPDLESRSAAPFAPLSNLGARSVSAPVNNERCSASAAAAALPFAARTFTDRWSRASTAARGKPGATRGKVVYFHDTFIRVQLPAHRHGGGQAAGSGRVRGHRRERRVCCGRPLLSKGFVDEAQAGAATTWRCWPPTPSRGSRSSAPSRAAS